MAVVMNERLLAEQFRAHHKARRPVRSESDRDALDVVTADLRFYPGVLLLGEKREELGHRTLDCGIKKTAEAGVGQASGIDRVDVVGGDAATGLRGDGRGIEGGNLDFRRTTGEAQRETKQERSSMTDVAHGKVTGGGIWRYLHGHAWGSRLCARSLRRTPHEAITCTRCVA